MRRWLMSLSGVDFGEEEVKKTCMPVSVRTHRERNALNAPEDAFNDRYKLSIFPCRKTQSPFMGTEATCDNSRGLCWIHRQQKYLTYLHTSDQSAAFLPYLGTDRPTDLIMFKMNVAVCFLLFLLTRHWQFSFDFPGDVQTPLRHAETSKTWWYFGRSGAVALLWISQHSIRTPFYFLA